MAIGDSLCSVEQYRMLIDKQDTDEDETILIDLKAVSRILERKIGRWFNKDVAATRTFFVGGRYNPTTENGKVLYVPDLAADPTSITIDDDDDGSFADETALTSSDYLVMPLNAALEPEAEPYTQIYLTRWGDKNKWTDGEYVQIVGDFGWPAVPDAVAHGVARITAILRLETPLATNQFEAGVGLTTPGHPMATRLAWELVEKYGRSEYR